MKTTDRTNTLGLREPRDRPNGEAIRTEVQRAVRDGMLQWERIQHMQRILVCDREGRDGTGTTGKDSNGRLRGPFLGSSDVDLALAEEVLEEKTDMVRTAVRSGGLNSVPVDGLADAKSAGLAQMEMHYYLDGPMLRNVTQVGAQAAKWHRGFGSYIVGLGWRRRQHGRERMLALADVYAWAVEQGTQDFLMAISAGLEGAGELTLEDIAPDEAQVLAEEAQKAGMAAAEEVQAQVYEKAGLDDLAEVLAVFAPDLCDGEAKRAARAFQRGATEVRVCCYETVEDRPEWRGLRPGVDVLFPPETTSAAEAEWMLEPLWLTARQVAERSAAEGWDKSWTEQLLENPGAPFGLFSLYGTQFPWLLTTTGVGCSIPWEYRERDMFCPMLFTYRAASKSGVGAIYQCLVHDKMEGFGFHEMLETIDGLMPYEDFRSDLDEPVLLNCRGLIEKVEAFQNQLKGNTDAWFDCVSHIVNPVLIKPSRLEGTNVRAMLTPGSEISQSRTDAPYGYLELSNAGAVGLGEAMDKHFRKLVARRFALRHPELDPALAEARWQVETNDYLLCYSLLLRRSYEMIQAYGPERVRMRVTEQPGILSATAGGMARPGQEAVLRDEIRGSYDFSISYDTRNLVREWTEQRGKQFAAMLAIDNVGAVPRIPILRAFAAMIDPKLAGLIKGEEQTQQDQLARTMADIAAIVSGQEPPFVPGQNHKLALQYTEQAVTQSPLLQQYLANPQIQAVMENWLKQHKHQVEQEENKQVGWTGGRPVLSGGIEGNGR